ncbi:MAG: nitroreductase family protein [Gammaproteobacteria bacterium]|jgi:nitroreductase|nr:nitroreductase family protein [Gammaproteobacteria bacterium]MBT5204602.1 nitroreductase family protein [Gammaproteobacteria bacterium]MBT5602097.1 nitroreductase family protein [Gammaproteobacteria bacterium]MBT6246561.1 nitroreductase family protein [Gammaproteobacteria bacterium]
MELYEAMSTLRAVRRLRSDPIPDDVLDRVLQAAAWAPSGGNVQPFRIVVVKSAEKLKTIQSWYQQEWDRYIEPLRSLASSSDDVAAVNSGKIVKAGDYLANHLAEVPALLVFCFNPAHMAITDADLNRPSVVGGGSVYTAVQNVMLACRQEGLGCVLTTLLCYQEQAIKQLLDIPEQWGTCAHIPIGYPVLKGHGPISRRPVTKLVFKDSWGQPLEHS